MEFIIKDSPGQKRAVVVITNKEHGQRTIQFGDKHSNGTYYDGASEKKRENYLKRHGAGQENWSDPMSAGFWSRWVLWEKKGREETEKFLRGKLKPARVSVYLTQVAVKEQSKKPIQKVVKSPVK